MDRIESIFAGGIFALEEKESLSLSIKE